MTYRTLYKNGLAFHDDLKLNIDDQLERRIDANFPSLIFIDGGQGQGKTTLLIHLIDYINSKKNLQQCSLKIKYHPQLSLGGKEFLQHFNICKKEKLPALGYDEAGDFSKRGAISNFNRIIIRVFETFRSSNIIVFVCLPTFNVSENHIFDLQIPRMLLHLKGRKKGAEYGNYYAYSLYQMNWIRYWHNKLPTAIRYQCYKKSVPNFRGHFLNLPPGRAEELRLLSDHGKNKFSQQAEINVQGLLQYEDLARATNRSIETLRRIVPTLLRPAKQYGNRKFFDSSAIKILQDHFNQKRKYGNL
jgi:hypothetical protein